MLEEVKGWKGIQANDHGVMRGEHVCADVKAETMWVSYWNRLEKKCQSE